MSNDYYNFTSALADHTKARAAGPNDQFTAIAAAFALIPSLATFKVNLFGYCTDASAGPNTIVLTSGNSLASYTTGAMFRWKAAYANTAAATVNVDGLGAKPLKRSNGDALADGDIPLGAMPIAIYDGTNLLLVGSTVNDVAAAAASASAAAASASSAASSASAAGASATAAAASASAAATSATAASVSATGTEGTWAPTDGSSQGIVYTGTDCRYAQHGTTTWISGTVAVSANANGTPVLIGGFPVFNSSSAEVWRIPAQGSDGVNYVLRLHTVAGGCYADVYSAANAQLVNSDLSGLKLSFNGGYRI